MWSIILNSTPRLHVIKRVSGHGLQQPERAREKSEHVFYSVHQQNPWANCQKTNDKHPHYLMFWDVDREWFIHFDLLLGVETGSGRNQGGSELFGLYFFQEFYTFKTYICLWSILSYFLCMMWSRDSASFFHMWAIQHCWKNFFPLIVLACSHVKSLDSRCECVSGLSVLFHWSIYV